MAHLSARTKKYIRYAIGGVLVTGMVLVTGFLSFSGMLVLNDSIYYAIAAFFLAGGIEGEVYAQNIGKSLLKIFSGEYLEDIMIGQKLAELTKDIDDENPHPSCEFLNDYYKQLKYTQELEDNHSDETHKEKLEKAKKRLKWMQGHLRANPSPGREFLNDYEKQLKYTNELEGSQDKSTDHEKLEKAQKRLKWMRQHFKDYMLGNYKSSENRPFYDQFDLLLKNALIEKKLAELIKPIDELHPHPRCTFLNTYQRQLTLVRSLEQSRDKAKRAQLPSAQKELNLLKQHFKKFMLDDYLPSESKPYYTELASLISAEEKRKFLASEKPRFQAEIRKKVWLGRLSWILNLGAGISCCLVGLDVAQSSILALTAHFGIALSGAALSASVIGLAAVGALGYTLLVHNTISDMIHNNTLQKWYRKTRDFFSHKPANLRQGLKMVGGALLVLAVVGLGVFATVATAGTWWYAAKAGAKMIPWVKNFASHLRAAAVSIMGVTTLTFNVVNSLNSAKSLVKFSVKKIVHQIKDQIKEYRQVENSWQQFNPLRILIKTVSLPFKMLSFCGHLIAMSVMGDKLSGVDPKLTTGLSTSSEFLTDYDILFPEEHHHASAEPHARSMQAHRHSPAHMHSPAHTHSPSHSHSPAQREGAQPQGLEGETRPGKPHRHKHKHHDHEHSHADIAGICLKIALFPLYLLSAAWDCYHSKKNSDPEKQLTYAQALKKAFVGLAKKTQVSKPELSSTWLQFEKQDRIQKTVFKASKLYQPGKENQQSLTDLEVIDQLRTLILLTSCKLHEKHPKPTEPLPLAPVTLIETLTTEGRTTKGFRLDSTPEEHSSKARTATVPAETPKVSCEARELSVTSAEALIQKRKQLLAERSKNKQQKAAQAHSGTASTQTPSYLETDGTINPALFFSTHAQLSKQAHAICNKLISRANDSAYHTPTPVQVY